MEQAAQVAEWEREQGGCREHGGPREDCGDQHRAWYPQRAVCFAAMERAAAEWKYGQRHKTRSFHDGTFPADLDLWSEKRSDDTPYHYLDGVTFWVADRDLAPHDHFLGGAENCDDCKPEEVTDGNEA